MAEHLDAIVAWRREWGASLSDDDQAKVTADRAASREDPVKSERMAEMAATFNAADTNQDGKLNQEEFTDFMGKMKQNSEARGVPMAGRDQVPEDLQQKMFDFMVAHSGEGADGVTMAGFGASLVAIGQAMQAAAQ